MKKLFLSLVALFCATVSFAQSQIATLSQDETIKTFYGPGSFAEAMKAAKHGDVITLSSGTFSTTTINKAVILRGTGMLEVTDSTEFFAPTIIEGATTINVTDTIPQHLEVEGIKFNDKVSYSYNLKNAVFKKCNFYSIDCGSGSNRLTNAVLLGCRVRDNFKLIGTVSCINSVLRHPYVPTSLYSINNTFEFSNCVLTWAYPNYLPYCRFQNCYIYNNYTSSNSLGYDILPSTCVVNNCVSNVARTFSYSINPSNKVCEPKNFFKSYSVGSSTAIGDSYKYTLTETAASTYIGDDGTQVGIYGGNLPYEDKVAIPRITKCVVAGKSSKEGKLSVDVKVEAE